MRAICAAWLFECVERAAGTIVPRKFFGLFQAVALELFSEGSIGQHNMKLSRYFVFIMRVKQSIRSTNQFRQTGRVGSNYCCATAHGLQHRQAEAFVPGGEHECCTQIIQRYHVRIRDKAGQEKFVSCKTTPCCQMLECINLLSSG